MTAKAIGKRSAATELLGGCAAMRFRKTARRVSQIYDQHLAEVGLTITQYGILAGVSRRDGISIGALAEGLVMDPTTLTRNLKPLEVRRLLVSKPDKDDRRGRALSLTPAGATMLKAAVPHWEKAQTIIAEALRADAPGVALSLDRMLEQLSK
ncbi:MAG: MarR family winged helix-turn-helix transcriptional regulator [Hyphomicrobiaceae bacterium]|nr:winged helix-turn-helix transcriptional regulator [Hyphomicrobiaceae bacterium]